MYMAEPPGTKSGSRLPILYCEKPQTFRGHLAGVSSLRELIRGSWFANSGELGIRQNDRSDVREERNDVCILDRRLAGMGAVVPVLEIYVNESVSLIAVQ